MSDLTDGARVRDVASIVVYGLHRGLDLVDGVGRHEFASAHDPVPATARPEFGARGLRGDPFDDPGRPLVLTLASDCADLPERIYSDLLSLSRFPGVELSLVPGLADLGYERVLRLDWTLGDHSTEVTQSESVARRADEAFASFDSVAPAQMRRPANRASAWPQSELVAQAHRMFDAPAESAARLVHEAIAHKAIGNDYIVSATLVRARRFREAGWPNDLGACTAEEGFALAGLKSRMYRAVPLSAEPHGLVSQPTGLYRDLAVTRLSPRLWRAISAALAPDALPDEAACAERLLAVRSRLNDLLVARDEILKLARRDALGGAWGRPFDQGPVSGPTGNELSAHMAYHLMSSLNALTAIADNLTWITRRRSGITLRGDDTSSTFARLVIRRGGDRMTETLTAVVEGLQRWPRTPLVLALLRLRNAFAHREGVDFGHVSIETMTIPRTRKVAAVWFGSGMLGLPVRVGDRDIDLFHAGSEAATLVAGRQFAVFTFPRLVAVILSSSLALTNEMLSRPQWQSPRRWLIDSAIYGSERHMRRLWRPDLQRLLLGVPRRPQSPRA